MEITSFEILKKEFDDRDSLKIAADLIKTGKCKTIEEVKAELNRLNRPVTAKEFYDELSFTNIDCSTITPINRFDREYLCDDNNWVELPTVSGKGTPKLRTPSGEILELHYDSCYVSEDDWGYYGWIIKPYSVCDLL